MQDELKKRLDQLEAKNAELEEKIMQLESGVNHYIKQHSQWHLELNDMIYPSYYRTHPEYMETMEQYYKTVEKKSGENDKPKK